MEVSCPGVEVSCPGVELSCPRCLSPSHWEDQCWLSSWPVPCTRSPSLSDKVENDEMGTQFSYWSPDRLRRLVDLVNNRLQNFSAQIIIELSFEKKSYKVSCVEGVDCRATCRLCTTRPTGSRGRPSYTPSAGSPSNTGLR